ncbi:murein hydrolase activator EnvC family protein, partial [Pedobacter sp.]
TVVLNKLSKQEKQFKQDIKKKRQQQSLIDRQIQAAIAREIAAARKKAEEEERERERIAAAKAKAENKPVPTASKPRTTSEALRSTPEAAKLSDAFEANRGSLPSPVATGYITGRFGAYKVDQATAMRNGVIFQTSEGAAVRAVFNGTVSSVFSQFGRYYVVIIHGEYFTVYEGLQSVSVRKGEKVTTKETIGVAGTSDGVPELGFQIHRGAVAQNPESWLAR